MLRLLWELNMLRKCQTGIKSSPVLQNSGRIHWLVENKNSNLVILKNASRGGMHNEGVPLHSNVMPILVAAQCY